MSDRAFVTFSVIVGAALGGLIGFVLFTERGRRLRTAMEPRLNELLGEARKLQDTVLRAKNSVSQSWQEIESFVGEMGEQGAPWAGTPGGREH